MRIAGEYENIPSWVADWPHCCDFVADTCDRLRWSAMVPKALTSQQNASFHRIVWPGLMSFMDSPSKQSGFVYNVCFITVSNIEFKYNTTKRKRDAQSLFNNTLMSKAEMPLPNQENSRNLTNVKMWLINA